MYRGGQPADAWVMKLPKETQAYVAANVKALQGSGGMAPKPTELDFVNNAVASLPPGSGPQVVNLTRTQAVQQFGIINKSFTEQGDAALGAAQRWISQSGKTVAQLPPELSDALARYAPGKLDDLVRYSKALERGDTVTDLVLYNRLESHPEELSKLTDPQFESLRAHLAPADFKTFSKQRSAVLNGADDQSAEGYNSPAVREALNTRLAGLGINAAPPPKETAAVERVGGIRQFVRQSVLDAQAQAGKKFTRDEVNKHIDGLFASSVDFKGALWGTSTQNLMSMELKDLPSGAAEGLKLALVNSGNKAPTNNDILNLYRKMRTK